MILEVTLQQGSQGRRPGGSDIEMRSEWEPAMQHSWGKSIPDTWNSKCKALGLDSWCVGEIVRRQLNWRKVS